MFIPLPPAVVGIHDITGPMVVQGACKKIIKSRKVCAVQNKQDEPFQQMDTANGTDSIAIVIPSLL